MLTAQAIIAVQPSGASPTGIMKMPDPIIPPTTRAVAIQNPNGRLIAWSSILSMARSPLPCVATQHIALSHASGPRYTGAMAMLSDDRRGTIARFTLIALLGALG